MEVVNKEAFYAVGLKQTMKEHELFVKMPRMYKVFYERVFEIKNQTQPFIIDICLEKVHDNYTQCLCVEVRDLTQIPEDMVGITIPKGNYLYEFHKGQAKEIYDVYVKMYDYALEHHIKVDEFKIEMHDDSKKEYHLYLRIEE